ncbi:putative GRAS family transcription factor family protein [Hibiscus syriacus]|uniref:DELLA protein n=1 Tax=Hibiscus syriacus TaxID=106335 RepID=A0A6A2YUX7_HIBSY|nr:putative GRAS family transcription factor family protein [Hibiscus syriacus]
MSLYDSASSSAGSSSGSSSSSSSSKPPPPSQQPDIDIDGLLAYFSQLASDAIHYNPSVLASWVDSLLSEFAQPPTCSSEFIINNQTVVNNAWATAEPHSPQAQQNINYEQQSLNHQLTVVTALEEDSVLLARVNTVNGIGKVAGHFIDALGHRIYREIGGGSVDGGALALRPGGPPLLRLTGTGPPSPDGHNSLREICLRLAELARSVNVRFAFRGVAASRLEDVNPWMIEVNPKEAVAVNSIMQLHCLLGSDPNRDSPIEILSKLSK